MPLITFDGPIATNPFLFPQTSHIELSHPAIIDRLLLAEYTDKPYENYRTGQSRSDNRSLLGAIRVKGGNWKKEQWECNFLASQAQVALFEQLVQAQQTSGSVVIIDRWVDGLAVGRNVWVEVDRQYLSTVANGQWYRLQFQVLEV